jgi:purine-binding chemotaxis protein CheW
MGDDETGVPRERAADLQEAVLRERAQSLALEEQAQVDESQVSVLLFSLGDEWYGVRISEVREIYNEYVVTPVPCVPDFIRGVLNIRGEIVSVTDPRALLGLGRIEIDEGSEAPPVIIVADGQICTALMVDAIGDIVDIASDAVEPPVAMWDKAQSEYVSGAFYTGERLVALMNLTRVLAPVGGE